MKIGLIGLGRMGAIIAGRIVQAGHTVIGFDPNLKAQETAQQHGATIAESIEHIAQESRIIWLMVPAGKPVDATIETLEPHLQAGDIIIDGGNSKFENTIERAERLAAKNITYLDCGTSGGLFGEEVGFSLMIGGDKTAFEKVEPIFKAVAAPGGYALMGSPGAGHYVKMIHNGIEYSMLQAYAEGFALIKQGHYKNLDLAKISDVWNNGGVIRSFILELCTNVFQEDQSLDRISGEIGENLTGRWTIEEAKKQGIAMDLLERSLTIRAWSRQTGGNYTTKIIAMLRNQFGGHDVKTVPQDHEKKD